MTDPKQGPCEEDRGLTTLGNSVVVSVERRSEIHQIWAVGAQCGSRHYTWRNTLKCTRQSSEKHFKVYKTIK